MGYTSSGNTEEAMILLLRQNDQQSFFKFYDHYAPLIFGIIKSIVEGKENAENVFQNCFEQLWKNKSNFNASQESIFSWIYKLTKELLLQSRAPYSFTTAQEEKLALELIIVHGYSFYEISSQMNIPVDNLKSKIRTALQTGQNSSPQ